MTSILKVSTLQDPTNSNTALSIDTSGRITTPARPAFRAVISASTSGQNYSTEQVLPLDVENFDIGNNFDLSTREFTVPIDGVYYVAGILTVTSVTGATSVQLNLFLNGVRENDTGNQTASHDPQGGGHATCTHTALLQLSAGDVVTYKMDVNGDTSVNLINAEFSGFLVG